MAGTKEFEISAVVTDTVTGKKTAWKKYGEGDCSLESIQHGETVFNELLCKLEDKRKEYLLRDKGKGRGPERR